jgi:hypothetical protein
MLGVTISVTFPLLNEDEFAQRVVQFRVKGFQGLCGTAQANTIQDLSQSTRGSHTISSIL